MKTFQVHYRVNGVLHIHPIQAENYFDAKALAESMFGPNYTIFG